MSYFQHTKPDCKIESFYTTGRQKKTDRFRVDGFCSRCNTVFEAMGCFYHFCPRQELRPSLTEEDVKRGSRRRELNELRRSYIQEKGFTVIEMWECEWWRLYKASANVKLHIREKFPYRRSITEQQLLEGMKKGSLFGYVQCDIEVPENLRVKFANFPPIFKNTLVSKNDNGDLMKTCRRRGNNVSTSENADIKLHITEWNTYYSSAFYFIYNWVLFAQKYTALLSALQSNASTVLCSQQWMHEGKVTKIQIQVS